MHYLNFFFMHENERSDFWITCRYAIVGGVEGEGGGHCIIAVSQYIKG